MLKKLALLTLLLLIGCQSAESEPVFDSQLDSVADIRKTTEAAEPATPRPTGTLPPTAEPTATAAAPSPQPATATELPPPTASLTPQPTDTPEPKDAFVQPAYMEGVATPTESGPTAYLSKFVRLGPEPVQTFNQPAESSCSAEILPWQIGQMPNTVAHSTVIADNTRFLRTPRDLAFNPRNPTELWIVNYAFNSVAIIDDAYSDERTIEYRRDNQHEHFMHRPAAIAFGGDKTSFGIDGTFATIHESRDPLGNDGDFMGPTLFSSDRSIFGQAAAADERQYQTSHIDMLHETPLGMGIAWERDNVYWAFGGLYGDIVRYDFVEDHDIGYQDHDDGIIGHYMMGEVARLGGVPSHLEFEQATKLLYIADTGNQRILRLDTTSGVRGDDYDGPNETDSYYMNDAQYEVLVSAEYGLISPSGLALVDGILYVGDNATGQIHAFTRNGKPLNVIDTGVPPNGLMGLAIGADDKLYFVDAHWSRVLRLDCITEASQ